MSSAHGTGPGLTLVAALASALVACHSEPVAPALARALGTHAVVDSTARGDTGLWPSLALDSRDRPHLAYCDIGRGDVVYAVRDGKFWRTQPIVTQGRVGKYLSLALDSHDLPAIVFYDQDQKKLRFARLDTSGAWFTRDVAWGLEVGVGARLTFDAADMPHLFFYLPSGKVVHSVLVFAPDADAAWHEQVVSAATPHFATQMGVQWRADEAWLSFVDWDFRTAKLVFMRGAQKQIVPTPHGTKWQSAVVGANNPAVVHIDLGGDLQLAQQIGADWQQRRLATQVDVFAASSRGDALTVAYSSHGRIVLLRDSLVSARAPSTTDAKDESRMAPPATALSVDTAGPAGDALALALTKSGRAVLAYHARSIRGIRVFEEAEEKPAAPTPAR